MKLKRILGILFTIVGLLGSMYASAQSWGGGYAEAGLGLISAQADVTETDIGTSNKYTIGRPNIGAQFGAGWRLDAGNMVYGVGIFLAPLASTVGETSFSAPGAGGTGSSKTRLKNFLGLSFDAGWRAAPATLIYGRVSIDQAKGDYNYSDNTPFSMSFSGTFSGFGVGAGVRHLLSKNAYVFVDWHYVQFGAKTFAPDVTTPTFHMEVRPTVTTGLVGMGWKF